jgi:hypothetical protein
VVLPVPVSFHILPHRQLILFTYTGHVTLQESMDIVAQAAAHPEYQPWMRQLCDLSAVTGVERDFPKLLRMQARIIEDLMPQGHDLQVLFFAPTRAGQEMAHMARKSWEGLNSVMVLIQDQEAAVLELLGLRETSLTQLHHHLA